MAKRKSKQPNESAEPIRAARTVSSEERQRMIAEAAYYHALERRFCNGSLEDDWLQAEQEINRVLLNPSLPMRSERTAPVAPANAAASAHRHYGQS